MKKILLVDDSQSVLAILKEVMTDAGYAVVPAETGKEALEKAVKEKPDAAVIDTLLPDMDGFDVSSGLRRIQGLEDIKIMIITGSIDAVDAIKARKAGADDYCVKTEDFSVIIEGIKRLGI